MGLDYGPGFRGIKSLFLEPGQVLAELTLPQHLGSSLGNYLLHPSLLDSAVQTTIALMLGASILRGNGTPKSNALLPFSLKEIEIFRPCTESMWSRTQQLPQNSTPGEVKKFDIELYDQRGQLCCRMQELSLREGGRKRLDLQPTFSQLNLLVPNWDVIIPIKHHASSTSSEKILIIGGSDIQRKGLFQRYPQAVAIDFAPEDRIQKLVKKLETCGIIDHILWITETETSAFSADNRLIEAQNRGVLFFFRLIKALLHSGYDRQSLMWSIFTFETQAIRPDDPIQPTHAGLHGLIGSMAKEHLLWKVRLIDLEKGVNPITTDALTLPWDQDGNAWCLRRGEWYRQQLTPLESSEPDQSLYRRGGVYVVIGGAGGIGFAWSEAMIRTHQAKIIWIGRREKDERIESQLDTLSHLGETPLYLQADAADPKSLQKAYHLIKQSFPQINGIVHSAIVLADQALANMTEENFRASFSAKVDTSVSLAQVFQGESLDFTLFFSSIMSLSKASGQSNYAAGCTFKDAFAHQLNQQWECPVKVMNWGYWGSVGVVASSTYQTTMSQLGLASIEPAEGMNALEVLLGGPLNQLTAVKILGPNFPKFLGTVNKKTTLSVLKKQYSQALNKNFHFKTPKTPSMKIGGLCLPQEMEELLLDLLREQLQVAGLIDGTFPLPAHYPRWLKESLSILRNSPQVKSRNGGALWTEWEHAKQTYLNNPHLRSQTVLVEKTLRALPEILKGKQPPTNIIFPDSSMELVEGIYKHNAISDFFNEILADAVVSFIRHLIAEDPTVQIRILEVGAGTGGTSWMVLKQLQPFAENLVEYCYTDLSKAFLHHGEKEYSSLCPQLDFRIFDASKPIAEQGFEVGAYDLVIATNVFHAIKNIRSALRNAKALLRPGGLILLNELSKNTILAHLTFGLLEGWWHYEDSELRLPGSPVLLPTTWSELLQNEGFDSIHFPAKDSHDLSQQIIIASSNGIIQQEKSQYKETEKKIPANSQREPTQKSSVPEEAESPIRLREKATAFLQQLIGKTLKIDPEKINPTQRFESYGIDSILVIQLTSTLREKFKNISSTLFFEVQTLEALTDYLIETELDSMRNLLDSIVSEKGFKCPVPAVHPISLPNNVPFSRKPEVRVEPVSEERVTNAPERKDIAIIGLSGRFPESADIYEFWDNLKAGRNCISEIPSERWNWKEYFDSEKGKEGRMYSRWGGFLSDIHRFDTLFFNISPNEAIKIDPQERVFLETAYACIEDAGYTPDGLSENKKVGVFVGAMNGYYPTGARFWSIANRVSWSFDFQGPSMAIDTACSASLTAIHQALESLASGTSECAIAGGVSLIQDPKHLLELSALTMISAGDRLSAFGDGADGFVDGEAVGAVLLKPLSQAIKDGDHIYGVLKGSSVNAGGKTNGYTVPNPIAQSQLIKQTLQQAGVNARNISYVEAHGTGTPLGDPIEIRGLSLSFGEYTADKQYCAIGSVKTNIGHCESGAGIAGLTKVLLQLKYQQLVPSLHSKHLNREIDFKNTPFVVQQRLIPWERPRVTTGEVGLLATNGATTEVPRIASISSFGAGGANAHVIIQEYSPEESETASVNFPTDIPVLIPLSARNDEGLTARVRQLLHVVRQGKFSSDDLHNLAYTLQVGRVPMAKRLGILVKSLHQLEEKLSAYLDRMGYIENLYQNRTQESQEFLDIFSGDEDIQRAFSSWLHDKKLHKILILWVQGVDFDWNHLYTSVSEGKIKKPCRISLPTYPFAGKKYNLSPSSDFTSRTGKIVRKRLSDFSFLPRWVPVKYFNIAGTPSVVAGEEELVTLIIYTQKGIKIQEQLHQSKIPGRIIDIRLDHENFSAFGAHIEKLERIDRIFFLGGIGDLEPDKMEPEQLEQSQESGTYSLFRLIKSLIYYNFIGRSLHIRVVTNDVCPVFSEQPGNPTGAGLHGLVRSIANEYPFWKIDCVDFSLADTEAPSFLARMEIPTKDHQAGKILALRGQVGFMLKLEPAPLPAAVKSLFKIKGVYLILGGAGGISLELSQFLAKTYQARLVLIGRSPLNHKKKKYFEEMESAGAEVLYLQADATDLKSLKKAVTQAKSRFGKLNGVIHSAIVLKDVSLQRMQEEEFLTAYTPKVQGSVNLYQAVKGEALDFMMFFSSVNSFFANPGQSNYVSGSTFKDAFALYLNRVASFPVRVINWGFWGTVGVASEQRYEKKMQSSGFLSIEPWEGLEIIDRVLAIMQSKL